MEFIVRLFHPAISQTLRVALHMALHQALHQVLHQVLHQALRRALTLGGQPSVHSSMRLIALPG
jgi:copper homeostasis protein CutC